MSVALIAAVAANGVIGCNNRLPWHLPEDLKYFVRMTRGKPVIMGRLTWETLEQPLPGRPNIVVSSKLAYEHDSVHVVPDLAQALALGESLRGEDDGGEIMVIGGSGIYRAALPRAQRMYLTEVHANFPGDIYFPPWRRAAWREVSRRRQRAVAAEPCDYSFVVYERVGPDLPGNG